MADDSRIEELRGRIRKDPASIAFAQLAEELRQAKRYDEAVAVCRTGLALYPAYLSARVTLGRCLIALDQLDEAQRELEHVRDSAPDNLAAVRALAEIQSRLKPDVPHINDARDSEIRLPRSADQPPLELRRSAEAFAKAEALREGGKPDATYGRHASETSEVRLKPDATYGRHASEASEVRLKPDATYNSATYTSAEDDRAVRTVAALDAWLAAIHVARAHRSA